MLVAVVTQPWNQPEKVATPLETGTFPDGTVIEILEATGASNLRMESHRRPSIWALGRSVHGGTYHFEGVRLNLEFLNHCFIKAELQQDYPSLILLARMRDSNDLPVSTDFSVFYNSSQQASYGEIVRNQTGFFDEFDHVSDNLAAREIPYFLEVEDGRGGWTPLSGPIIGDDQDGRGFFVTPVFPRLSPRLKLRSHRPGHTPVIIEIDNPGHNPSGKPVWTVDPIPSQIDLGEVALEVTGLEYGEAGEHFIPIPEFLLHPKYGHSPEEYQWHLIWMGDESGNQAQSFVPLPGTAKIRFGGYVIPSKSYRWRESQADFVAEGVWRGSSPHVDLTITDEGQKMGMEHMTLTPPTGRQKRWTFSFKGEARESKVPETFHLVVFLDEESESDAVHHGRSGSSSGSANGDLEYEMDITWQGVISSGQKVRVAFVKRPRPAIFETTLAIPTQDKMRLRSSAN